MSVYVAKQAEEQLFNERQKGEKLIFVLLKVWT